MQKDREKVMDFIDRLEKTFHLTYGNDRVNRQTGRSVVNNVKYTLMESPAVPAAVKYNICV